MARQLSAAMDIDSLRHPSWCLCRLLDPVIGNKEEFALRNKTSFMFQYIIGEEWHHKTILSGSRGEGFFFQSSDIDIMFIDQNTLVIESITSVPSTDDGKTVLLLKKDGCNSGFVILQLLNRTNDVRIIESVVEYNGHPVVSSLLCRDMNRGVGEEGHGPCNTFYYRAEVDLAHCFQCETWPTEANEFIHRRRIHGWPPKSLLQKIICKGCHLVPIGDKNPELSHIQWRLSFSAAEKSLTHSFNHIQFLVYGLLKIFLKQFINKIQSVKDILCSYFLKTAMFYSIESTPSSFWREHLLIPCFWYCFNKLLEWVEEGYCPNYFVPQNNMFRSKVHGQSQRVLLSVLKQCNRSGWTCICCCEDLKLHGNDFFLNHTKFTELVPNESNRESYFDACACQVLRSVFSSLPFIIHRFLLRTLTMLCYSRTQHERDVSTFLVYSVLRSIGVIKACTNVGINNKNKYRKSYHMLLASAKSNVCTGTLHLATFYYLTGQYKKAVYLCNRVISHWKPYVMYVPKVRVKVYNRDMYERYICGRGVSVINKAKSAYAFDIVISANTKYFFPAELHYDIEAVDQMPTVLPPLPYTVFLLFLCHHKLGNIGNSVNALHDLQALIHDEQQGYIDHPIVLNMLAVCQNKLGDIQSAIDMCLLSLDLQPDKNGAEKILEALLRQSH